MREEKVLLLAGSPPETQTVLLEKLKVEQPVLSGLALLCLLPFVLLPLLPQMATHPVPHPLCKKGIRMLGPMYSPLSRYTQYRSRQGVLLHVLQIQVFVSEVESVRPRGGWSGRAIPYFFVTPYPRIFFH